MEVCGQRMKEKRRNSEKRKEKSRDAARSRRSKESEIFSDLAHALPVPSTVASHLDKASIMRLVIADLRIRELFKTSPLNEKKLSSEIFDNLYLKALGGVIIVLSVDGEMIYVSNNVPSFLGVSQVDLLGHSIYDVSHPCDHSEIKDLLAGKVSSDGQLSLFVRVKCTLSNKGRNFNLKSASYKVLHVTGSFINSSEGKDKLRVVTIAHPIPHPVDIEVPLGTYTFLSKHSLDMKYTYADERMSEILGYDPESLIGKSLYNFHHVQDNKGIEQAFKSLFAKGQSETGHYRFLAQGGGFVWVCTQATLIYCEKGNKPQSVVCVNYIISEKQNEVEIYSTDQLEWANAKKQKLFEQSLTNEEVVVTIKPKQVQPRPQPATAKIFAKRTADMNKGFLIFSDDDSGFTMMKDEPEDLTHLAPTAGDVCVPLLNQMVDKLLPDTYCPLIDADKETPLFSSYRDDSSTGSLSPLAQSPDGCSLPSLSSLGEESGQFEDDTMKSILGIDLVEPETDDIADRSPYIPMSETDDLPLLMSSDLLWNVNYSVTSGSNPSSGRCTPTRMEIKPQENQTDFSSLAHLLQRDKENRSNKYPDDQGGGHHGIAYASSVESESRKRVSSLEEENAKKRKQTIVGPDLGNRSVLMNLLVSGHDINSGYICIDPCHSTLRSRLKKES